MMNCEEKIKALEARIAVLEEKINAVTVKHVRNTESDVSTSAAKLNTVESYKQPNLDFATPEFMLKLFEQHGENLPYALFNEIYFTSGANNSIVVPHKTATHPRFLEVCDHGDPEKIKTHDAFVEINRIICDLINSRLTKGDIYMKMEMADKRLLGDMACKRFDKKLTGETIKNYINAVVG